MMRWKRHVVRMAQKGNAGLVRKTEKNDGFKDLDIVGRIILIF
jgi:hypothetical protein